MDSKEHQVGATAPWNQDAAELLCLAAMFDAQAGAWFVPGYDGRRLAVLMRSVAALAASGSQEQRSTKCQSPDPASSVQSDLRLAAQIRNLVIEECAVICEQMADAHAGGRDPWDGGACSGLTQAAAAIRAAKQ